jgi:phage terminase large subunit
MIQGKWLINDAYIPYVNDTTRTQIFFGGSSSGKSRFESQRLVSDLLGGKRNYLVVRNTGKTHSTTTHNEIQQAITDMNVADFFTVTKSDLTITCKNGTQALFAGLDDVEKIKGIRARRGDITDVWIEEATEVAEDDYRQLTKRLRGLSESPKRITMTFNPIMRTHWIFKEFFKEFKDTDKSYRNPDLSILRTTYKDNRFLTDADRRYLESETNEYYYKVYTLGEWGSLGHQIFTNWHVENLTGLRDVFGTYNNGLDFGYTNDPTAMLRFHIKRNEKKIYICREMYEYGLLNDAIALKLKPIIHDEMIACDSAEPKSIAELRRLGINAVSAAKGPGSVNQGIQFLQQFEVIVHRDLQNVINELQLYQWKVNRNGDVINEPVDKNNHLMDAWRYGASSNVTATKRQNTFDPRVFGMH